MIPGLLRLIVCLSTPAAIAAPVLLVTQPKAAERAMAANGARPQVRFAVRTRLPARIETAAMDPEARLAR